MFATSTKLSALLLLRASRLNPISVAVAAKELYKLSAADAKLVGSSAANAFNNSIITGLKAKTSEKRLSCVLAIYNSLLCFSQ